MLSLVELTFLFQMDSEQKVKSVCGGMSFVSLLHTCRLWSNESLGPECGVSAGVDRYHYLPTGPGELREYLQGWSRNSIVLGELASKLH